MQDQGGRNWQRFLWTTATVSALVTVFAFHPAVSQNSREPTWLATFLWTRFPAWNNPLPEVFVETELHTEVPAVPVATAGCQKVFDTLLLAMRPDQVIPFAAQGIRPVQRETGEASSYKIRRIADSPVNRGAQRSAR